MADKRIRQLKNFMALIVIVCIAIFSEEMFFPTTSYQKVFWILMALVGIFFLCRQCVKGTLADSLVLLSVPVPLMIITTATIAGGFMYGDMLGVSTQAFTTTMFIVVDILMVIALLSLFRHRSVDLLLAAIVICYIATLMNAFVTVDFMHILRNIVRPDLYVYRFFERHDIGIAVVPLLLYYLYPWIYGGKKRNLDNLLKIIILIGIMLLCGKRSAYLGLAGGVGIMVFFKLCKKNLSAACKWVMAAGVILPFLYVCAIRLGILGYVANLLGINTMGRIEVYEWFSDHYTLSPLYLGQGFQYIHRYMMAGLGSRLVNDYHYLHNTILQLYIEGGFWGFFLWFIHNAVGIPMMLRKWFDENTAVFYLVVIVATIVIFTVDNALTYPVYQVCLYTVVGAAMAEVPCRLQLFRKKK